MKLMHKILVYIKAKLKNEFIKLMESQIINFQLSFKLYF